MKTLKGRMKKRTAVKWLLYLVTVYLFASWGVNGVIHPLHYVRSAVMQTKPLQISEGTDGIVIRPLQDESGAEAGFVSFQAVSATYCFELQMLGYLENGEVQKISVTAWKGWNSVDLRELREKGKTWKELVVPWDVVECYGLLLEDAELSEYRKPDMYRMGGVYVSFLVLTIFWKCIWWLKERYTK